MSSYLLPRFLTSSCSDSFFCRRRHNLIGSIAKCSAGRSLRRLLLGLLVESSQEGATRTGNCRLTDVLPDVVGGLIAMALVVGINAIWRLTHVST